MCASEGMIRLSLRVARSGLCSRREAERLIQDGEVQYCGKIITDVALKVPEKIEAAHIRVKGSRLPSAVPPRMWLFAKRREEIVTDSDPEGRRTIWERFFQAVPSLVGRSHLHSIGRLDYQSEGLLLITTRPEIKALLEDPTRKHKRIYKVKAKLAKWHKRPADMSESAILREKLQDMKVWLSRGPVLEGEQLRPVQMAWDLIKRSERSSDVPKAWLKMVLMEGKNQEIRRLLKASHLSVDRLIRTHYQINIPGLNSSLTSFTLGTLRAPTFVKEIQPEIVQKILSYAVKENEVKE